MDTLENVSSLAEKFSEAQLTKAHDSVSIALSKAKEHILFLEAELDRLRIIVNALPSVLPKSNEELICEMEIDKLMRTSSQRNLTLEETKRFDLIVKNLYLAKESKKEIKPDYKTLPQGVTEATLVQIASVPGEADERDQ